MTNHDESKCTCCAKFPVKSFYLNEFPISDDCSFVDGAWLEGEGSIICRHVEKDVAVGVAERVMLSTTKLEKHLKKAGLRPDRLARISKDEIFLGDVLGTGGFAQVSEVEGFVLEEEDQEQQDCDSDTFNSKETAAREAVAESAHRRNVCGEEYQRFDPHRWPSSFAVKHVKEQCIVSDRFEHASTDLATEAMLLSYLDHPHIINIRGWSRDGILTIREGSPIDFFIILDLLPRTLQSQVVEWRHALRKYKGRLSLMPWASNKFNDKIHDLLRERLRTSHGIASAVEYMHSHGIINRDIKASNIGFDFEGEVKLFDFGLACPLSEAKGRCGTKSSWAPEVAKDQPYNLSADVYSFGIVLWEILALASSYETIKKSKETQTLTVTPDESNGSLGLPLCPCWPREIRDLLKRCLSFDSKERPSMSEVCETLETLLRDFEPKTQFVRRRSRRATFPISFSSSRALLADLDYVEKFDKLGFGKESIQSNESVRSTSVDLDSVSDIAEDQRSVLKIST
jgi:serine/threonine protein kinase